MTFHDLNRLLPYHTTGNFITGIHRAPELKQDQQCNVMSSLLYLPQGVGKYHPLWCERQQRGTATRWFLKIVMPNAFWLHTHIPGTKTMRNVKKKKIKTVKTACTVCCSEPGTILVPSLCVPDQRMDGIASVDPTCNQVLYMKSNFIPSL